MEHRLKELIKRLGQAIDESLSDSKAIADVIGEIKREGYDVLLVLEATIGFNRRGQRSTAPRSPAVTHKDLESSLTEQDEKFLRSMSIRLED